MRYPACINLLTSVTKLRIRSFVWSFSSRKILSKQIKTISEKETALKSLIENAKKKLDRLQDKQKIAIGELAYKHGLNHWDMATLNKAFEELANKHPNGK